MACSIFCFFSNLLARLVGWYFRQSALLFHFRTASWANRFLSVCMVAAIAANAGRKPLNAPKIGWILFFIMYPSGTVETCRIIFFVSGVLKFGFPFFTIFHNFEPSRLSLCRSCYDYMMLYAFRIPSYYVPGNCSFLYGDHWASWRR